MFEGLVPSRQTIWEELGGVALLEEVTTLQGCPHYSCFPCTSLKPFNKVPLRRRHHSGREGVGSHGGQ